MIAFVFFAAFSVGILNAQPGENEKQFVAKFLSYMHAERGPNYPEMMNCISPTYRKENKIDPDSHKINNYTLWGFDFESYSEEDNLVIVKIYGQKRSWTHRLTFKLSKESDRLYIIPSGYDAQWIDPWWLEETFVKP